MYYSLCVVVMTLDLGVAFVSGFVEFSAVSRFQKRRVVDLIVLIVVKIYMQEFVMLQKSPTDRVMLTRLFLLSL